jgi:hypothetical protein
MSTFETKNKTSIKFNCFFFFCGVIMAFSEIWKQCCLTFIVNRGVYDWWYFPFQLCSIAMYVLLVLPWVKNTHIRPALLSFLMNYSLLGGTAVFADTSGLHYPVPALTVHSYLWHVLLIITGISAGAACIAENQNHMPGRRLFRNSTFIYLGCCAAATGINLLFDRFGDINMFYINPDYEMQQIGFSTLAGYIGNIPAIILYILTTILGACILFHIWRLAARCYQHFFRH